MLKFYTQERLISNSGFKDYSHGAMNYAYDSFETIENGINSANQITSNSTLRRNGGGGSSSGNSGAHAGYDPYSSHKGMNGHGGHHSGGDYGGNGHLSYGDTRSLQRPRNSSALTDPRATYSLPRGSTSSSLPSYNAAVHQERNPDFYYLPSQRKYSGEVVRVFVDYNQAK